MIKEQCQRVKDGGVRKIFIEREKKRKKEEKGREREREREKNEEKKKERERAKSQFNLCKTIENETHIRH